MRAWFFIVLRAFMILPARTSGQRGGWVVHARRDTYRTMVAWMTYLRSSSTVFRTSVDSAFCSALIGMLRLIRIFFDLKPTRMGQETAMKTSPDYALGFKSYCSVSSLIRILALTSTASTCLRISLLIAVAFINSSSDSVSLLLYWRSTAICHELVMRMYFWFR